MKKSLVLVLATAAVLTAGCSRDIRTASYRCDDYLTLTEGGTDTLHIQMDIQYAAGHLPAAVLAGTNQVICGILDTLDYHPDVPDAAQALCDNILAEYRETLSELERIDDSEDYWRPTITYYSYTGYFAGRHGRAQTYILEEESYTGGAHGMYTESAFLVDRKTGNRITEAEFFTDGYREPLAGLLTERIYNLPEEDENFEGVNIDDIIFVDEIQPNGNFKVDERGVTYIFNPYEIGPYVLGIIHLLLPWEEVDPLVRK